MIGDIDLLAFCYKYAGGNRALAVTTYELLLKMCNHDPEGFSEQLNGIGASMRCSP